MPTTLSGSYISADGHVVEPKDLFSSRMDPKLVEKAPHIESRDSGDFYVMEGFGEFAIGLSGEGTAATDKAEGKEIHMAGLRYEDTRPGAWDPVERLKDQDMDGIRAEVMYPVSLASGATTPPTPTSTSKSSAYITTGSPSSAPSPPTAWSASASCP